MVRAFIISEPLVWALMALPLLHYLADFELQTNWMAVQKSKRLDALAMHVATYSLVFGLMFGWKFALVTFVMHFATDWVTSRWSRRKFPFVPNPERPTVLFDKEGVGKRSRHRFFCVIGFDQMLHAYQLIGTAIWLEAKPWWM